jgi:chromosome segregation ATPase
MLKVVSGLIETESGRVFELESTKGAEWLNTIKSFKYVPTGNYPEFTVRKEGKDDNYWYGYRRADGKLHKKYIGRILQVSPGRLEEIAAELENSAEEYREELSKNGEEAKVKNKTEQRLKALEGKMEQVTTAIAEVAKNQSPNELPNGLHNELAKQLHKELHKPLGNSELEELERLRKENAELKEQVRELQAEVFNNQQIINEQEHTKDAAKNALRKEESKRESLENTLGQKDEVIRELENKLAATGETPEAAELLNQVKSQKPKTKTTLGDIETILNILKAK